MNIPVIDQSVEAIAPYRMASLSPTGVHGYSVAFELGMGDENDSDPYAFSNEIDGEGDFSYARDDQ